MKEILKKIGKKTKKQIQLEINKELNQKRLNVRSKLWISGDSTYSQMKIPQALKTKNKNPNMKLINFRLEQKKKENIMTEPTNSINKIR